MLILKRKLGKNVKRAIHAINYGMSIFSVVNSKKGRVSIRRIKKAYLNLGFKVAIINNVVFLDRIN